MSFSVNDTGRLALLNVATQVRKIYIVTLTLNSMGLVHSADMKES